MHKTYIERFLAYFSASFGFLSALAGAFILGISFITAGQRASYGAGVACLGSAVLLLVIAGSLFRKVNKVKRFVISPSC
jgi:hypothetical protein